METRFFRKSGEIAAAVETICRNVRINEVQLYKEIQAQVAEYKATLSGNPIHIKKMANRKHLALLKELKKRRANVIQAQCTQYQIAVPYIHKIIDEKH